MSVAPQWTFAEICKVARQISGQLDPTTYSNSQVAFQVNSYYQYDFPREEKVEELYTQYTFMTLPKVSTYDLPGMFSTSGQVPFTHVEPKLYINGQAIYYTQNTNVFYGRASPLFAVETLGYGTGAATNFTYTTINNPIVPNQQASVMITELAPTGSGMTSVESFYDLGDGTVTNAYVGTLRSSLYPSGGSGTVNYMTGAISVTFATAPVLSQQLEVTYHFEQLGVPTDVLYYDRQFVFYPTPDTTYQVRIDAYFQPEALIASTDVPVKQEWGELLAIGAARKILRNLGQYDKYKELEEYFQVEKSKVRSDTDNQSMAQRSQRMC